LNSKGQGNIEKGLTAFNFICGDLMAKLRYVRREDGDDVVNKINENSKPTFDKYNNKLDHYFRNLLVIINIIDRISINDELDDDLVINMFNKGRSTHRLQNVYIEIVRAQLSVSELTLIFYYSLRNQKGEFHRLIKKYNLFSESLRNTDIVKEDLRYL
jgi:hypothetical protein